MRGIQNPILAISLIPGDVLGKIQQAVCEAHFVRKQQRIGLKETLVFTRQENFHFL